MTHRHHIRGPGELIATIPVLLGFEPRESVVLVAILEGGKLGVLLRVDRTDCLQPDVASPLVRGIVAHLARDGARSVVAVSFTDDAVRLDCAATDALRPALLAAGIDVEGWAVVDGRYFSPGCAKYTCCPQNGTVVPTAVARNRKLASVRMYPHGSEAGRAPTTRSPGEPSRRRAARAGDRWWAHRERDGATWRRDSFALWRGAWKAAARGDMPTDAHAGKLVAALQDRAVRDAVVVSLLPGRLATARGILAGSAPNQVSAALDVLLSPEQGRRPTDSLVAVAWELCGRLTSLARQDQRAPTLTLQALIAWWDGDSVVCRDMLEGAQAAEPGYRLAGLLECTLLAGIQPGWKRAA